MRERSTLGDVVSKGLGNHIDSQTWKAFVAPSRGTTLRNSPITEIESQSKYSGVYSIEVQNVPLLMLRICLEADQNPERKLKHSRTQYTRS